MSSSTHSPCAACKFLRRKCTQECVFAPYFPPEQPRKFVHVHRVYGASNVAKILNDLSAVHREDAVSSLAFEAEARLRDPVYGCVGTIAILQTKLKQLQADLYSAKMDLASYIGPQAALMMPVFHQLTPEINSAAAGGMSAPSNMMMLGADVPTDPQQYVASQSVQQHMYEGNEMMGFNVMNRVKNGGFNNGNGFNESNGGGGGSGGDVVSGGELGIGGFENNGFNN